jgi:ATP-dependent RNA helicase DDX46/PRP5
MPRHRDTRSPSPVGSSYSSSKRRGDDRRRDDRRSYRRSRSRSPDVRSPSEHLRRVREAGTNPFGQRRYRDRPRDRFDHDTHRPRRDRSRDRRRSRDRGIVRDERPRSRDRDPRERRDSRDRDQRRRDDSADSKRSGKRRPSRDGPGRDAGRRDEPSKPTKAGPTDEQKKAERLAKLEAWKQKQKAALEKQKEQQSTSAAGTRSLLEEIDKKSAGTPVGDTSPPTPSTPGSVASPAPYAGKFDPKAIVKRAAASTNASSKLGTDITLPEGAKQNLAPKPTSSNQTISSASKLNLKAKGNVSGFELAAKAASDVDKPVPKRGFDLGEEENEKRTLEKLPTPPLENGDASGDPDATTADVTIADDDDDDDDDEVMEGATEEEAAAAARAAAEKREERLQAQNLAYQAAGKTDSPDAIVGDQASVDVEMKTVESAEPEPAQEDLDPLDAFMSELGDPSQSTSRLGGIAGRNKPTREPEAMFGDDDLEINGVNPDPDDILAMATKKKKKEIPAVDHAKVRYEPFEKSFYVEPSELQDLTPEEVADLRLELDGIKIRGVDAPKPAVKWSQCGLDWQTFSVVDTKLGYEQPSSIQSQAIPAIMSGRDVIGVAKTGSGKTIAFLLPMFRHIKAQRPVRGMDGPVAIIMTPTRELATQIHRDCKPFLKALDLRAICAYGGAPIKDQIADFKRGAEIVVCTPGRMIDILAANQGRVTNLRRITYIVLDEADRMFDMGFEPQVMKLLGNIRPDRQTVLFSATFPRQMEALARKTLSRPVEIIVGGRSVVAPEITQIVEVRKEENKFFRLLELLGKLYVDAKNEDDRALIFMDRQESADNLLADLMQKGYPCMSIHGGKDQIDRDSTIHDFKAGVFPILIATSVAARGLDVKQLKLVVNFDAPNHLEDYVHRAGRTGRAGNTGTAVTFLTPEQDRYAVDIAKALKQSGQPVPEDVQKLVDGFMEKVKAGKEKASFGSGFKGKGLERLEQERDAARTRERRVYKTGEEGEDDEKEEKSESHADELIAKALGGNKAPTDTGTNTPTTGPEIDPEGKITVTKVSGTTSASKNPLDKVAAAVANINHRIQPNAPGVAQQGTSLDNHGPDAGAYHATLEINDFPQKARWAVTNRTNVAKILESTGTSITTKGNFYATGKEPAAGDAPKLYILVEGDTEVVVTTAMRELMRLLKEGTMAAADSESRAPASGRYSVV